MNSNIFRSITAAVVLLFAPMMSYTQDLQSTMQNLGESAAKSYVSPIVSGFGSNLNGGWFHSAPRSTKLGFDLELGIVAMGTFFGDEHKKFSASGTAALDPSIVDAMTTNIDTSVTTAFRDAIRNKLYSSNITVNIYGPTIVGSKTDSLKLEYKGDPVTITDWDGLGLGHDTTLTFLNILQTTPVTGLLEDLSFLPLAAPQLTVGTVFGTQAEFRFLPEVQLSPEIGKFKYFGFGIQHNPGVWLGDLLPIDVSAGYFTQTLEVGTLFKTTSTAFGVQASKKLGFALLSITPYAGFQLESSTMTFTYTPNAITLPGGGTFQPGDIKFELEGENKSRITVGLGLHFLFLNVNADYNIGTYNSFTAGIMLLSL